MLVSSYAPAIASVAGFYVLSYVPHFLKGYFLMKSGVGYNNHDPRGNTQKLQEKNVDPSMVSKKNIRI